MKDFWLTFQLHLRRLLRQKIILFCLVLLPCFSLGLGILAPANAPKVLLRVGLYAPPDSVRANRVVDHTLTYTDDQVIFVKATDPTQLKNMVAARVWDSGYVFRDDFDQRIVQGKTNRSITRVGTPTSMYLFSGWIITASIVAVCVDDITKNILTEQGLDPGLLENLPTTTKPTTQPPSAKEPPGAGDPPTADPGLTAQSMLKVTSLTAPETTGNSQESLIAGGSLTKGLTALFLLLISCLAAASHRQDLTTGFFSRVAPYVRPFQLFFTTYLALTALTGLAGLLALCIGAWFFSASFTPLWWNLLALACYLVFLAGWSYFLVSVFKKAQTILTLLPSLLIGCLLLSPILIDIANWLPSVDWLSRLAPTTLYLRAAASSASALAQMLAYTAGLLLLSFGLNYWHGKARSTAFTQASRPPLRQN